MTKATDVEDLLGGAPTPKEKAPAAKKAPAKKAVAKKAKAEEPAEPAAKKAPAKKAVAKKAKAEEPAEKAPRAAKDPITFDEGEKEALIKRIKQSVRKPVSSKDLAAKLDLPTRKLRQVLYSMQRAELITLELSSSRAAGMTVSPA